MKDFLYGSNISFLAFATTIRSSRHTGFTAYLSLVSTEYSVHCVFWSTKSRGTHINAQQTTHTVFTSFFSNALSTIRVLSFVRCRQQTLILRFPFTSLGIAVRPLSPKVGEPTLLSWLGFMLGECHLIVNVLDRY